MNRHAIPFDEFFLNFRRAAYRVYCRNTKMKHADKLKNILKEEYMVRSCVKDLMCEENRLRELMAIPISDILRYRDMADSIDPEEALRFLADRFIDNCGVSLGMRGFYDYCASYWIEKLDLENNSVLNEKYHGAYTLGLLLPYISDKYYDGLLEEYDSCAMSLIELRDILIEELENGDDEKHKIILCAGICDCLSDCDGDGWLNRYTMAEIEDGIINFKNHDLIRHRQWKDFERYRTPDIEVGPDTPRGLRRLAERQPEKFSDAEINHFIVLNDRLVELQHEVMEQVKVITGNLREQITKGFHQYDTFIIDGYIYVEAYEEDNTDELLNALSSFAKYSVIWSNDETSQEVLEDEIAEDVHWYANWGGVFHRLEKSHGLKLCRAFCHLFEESRVFTIGDIMKIKPEMLVPHVEINI